MMMMCLQIIVLLNHMLVPFKISVSLDAKV